MIVDHHESSPMVVNDFQSIQIFYFGKCLNQKMWKNRIFFFLSILSEMLRIFLQQYIHISLFKHFFQLIFLTAKKYFCLFCLTTPHSVMPAACCRAWSRATSGCTGRTPRSRGSAAPRPPAAPSPTPPPSPPPSPSSRGTSWWWACWRRWRRPWWCWSASCRTTWGASTTSGKRTRWQNNLVVNYGTPGKNTCFMTQTLKIHNWPCKIWALYSGQ